MKYIFDIKEIVIILLFCVIPFLNLIGVTISIVFLYIESITIFILITLFLWNNKITNHIIVISNACIIGLFFASKNIYCIYAQFFLFVSSIAIFRFVHYYRINKRQVLSIEKQQILEVYNVSCTYGITKNGSNTDIVYSLVRHVGEDSFPSDYFKLFLRTPLSIGDTLTKKVIGENKKLLSLIVSDNIKILKDNTFEGCPSLQYIYLPSSLLNIGNIFDSTTQLKKIFVPQWQKKRFAKYLPQHSHLIEEMNDNIYKIETKQEQDKVTIKINDITLNMIYVKKGNIIMGKNEYISGETRYSLPHKVLLTQNYYIGETPVIAALFNCVMGKDVVNSEKLDIPIVSITYNQCMEFIFRLNILTKLNFRLPTDTEWEYAARGGNKNKGYIYSGSDNIDDIAYFKDNSNHMIHTVKKKIPNELGLYDMSGNIFEICMDNPIDYMDRSEECYIDPILLYPDNADEFGKHIIRGGSWGTWEGMCRVDCLGCFLKNEEYDAASDWGFRLVLDEVYSLPNSFN